MPTRSSSLGNNVSTAVDREIGSQYDNVRVVAENIESVVTVGDHIDNVDTVATNIVDVHAVGGSIVDVRTVATNINSVIAVEQDIANVNAVAANTNNINTIVAEVVPNIDEIANASANAAIATAKANEAATSAAAALVSEQNAKASELAAGVSEDNAAASEVVAIAKATEASASAVTATTQANLATTKASEAAASAATATTKASEAAASAATATTKASEASASATSASGYSTSASNSATSASNSATTATTKANEASDSATIATSQALTATTKASDASASATAARNSELAAEALLDAFNDRYLGSFAVDPVTDNDGQPLLDGALYYNTISNVLKVYDVGNVMWYTIPQVQLSSLLDVQLTSVATGDMLNWNGTKWVNTSNVREHIADTSNPHSVTKAQVGLGDVDNTADSTKAVLSASKLTTARNVSVSGDATGTASFDGSADIDIVVTVTDDSHTHDGRYYTEAEIDNMLAGLDPLPTQTGNAGKYLTTDGTDASWATVASGSEHYSQEAEPTSPSVGATWYKPSTGKLYTRINDGTADVWIDTGASTTGVTQDYVEQAIDAIDALPSQTGNSGKFLTTDGTIASWATVVSDHGGLTGLADDDHPQYHNDVRGDARYYKKAEVDTALDTKQDTLVSGTNIKTINNTSILGNGNIVIDAGLALYNKQDTILTSGTYTVPVTGKYRITAIGAGGAGGARNTSVLLYPAATGGGAGGTCIHEVTLTAGQVLTISIGAGGVRGTSNTNGGDGGNTTVTGTGISLTANGGGGGKYSTVSSYNVTLAGGIGGTATGGNIANLTGGRGGNITSSDIFGALVTGGGGASLRSGAVTRGGDITLPSASGSASGTYMATGGGGCFFRGGDFTANTYSSASFATGGAGTGGNGEDLPVGYTDNYTFGGNALNAISSPLIGKGGIGSINSTTPYPSLAIGGATGGWSATTSGAANALSNMTLPLAGSGGVANSVASDAITETINTYFLGGGSGGSANNASNIRYSTRGGNGVVFIEYKG